MKVVSNPRQVGPIRSASDPIRVGDMVIAIFDGVGLAEWDYKSGDRGIVVDFKEGEGYYIRCGEKVYPGVLRTNWEPVE